MMTDISKKKVTFIVPVYADWPAIEECVDSLKEHVGVSSRHSVIFINDCGPEVAMIEKNLKQAIKDTNYAYYRNKKNLGFVGVCNRGVLEIDKTNNDILLLNSDAKVTHGFLEEMLEVLYASDRHGMVSPRSNNASINTVPLTAAGKGGIDPQASFKLFERLKTKLPRYQEAPVAHGFCMLIRRSLITKYGLFDPVFGRGYGEEVDFCLRVRKHGFISVMCNRAFVFHLEARSFTSETKAKLLEQNNKIIWSRYPTYRQSVRDYMERALEREAYAEVAAGGNAWLVVRARLKRRLKRNRRLYRLAVGIRGLLKDKRGR